MRDETLQLIAYLRRAQDKFFEERGIEGAYWEVNLEVREIASDFEGCLRTVVDRESVSGVAK